MREQLTALRTVMEHAGIDWLIIPSSDYHGSEYVHDFFKCREYVSGFTGSAGTLVVGREAAFLWTDGRYFLQAADQLSGSGIALMKEREPGVPEIPAFLKEKVQTSEKKVRIGFDGRVLTAHAAKEYLALTEEGAEILWNVDLITRIWPDRPAIQSSDIYELPLSVTGKTAEEKLAEIREEMRKEGADYLLLASLDEIAWTWNLRGNDVECNPVFFAYALISQDAAHLYTMRDDTYEEIYEALSEIGEDKTLWLDGESASLTLAKAPGPHVTILDKPTPVQLLKAVKNPAEITSTVNAHIHDGVAMVNFLYWIKRQIKQQKLTEMDAVHYVDNQRIAQGAFELSFSTIAGYGPDGAIIHYEPTPEHNAEMAASGFLLIDSGGQYPDGTTDITRTVALGPLTDKMKEYYTLVLRAHIDLAMARFKPETTGKELDAMTRVPLEERGLDYNHGTGHGVGHILNVHEGPQSISRRGEGTLLPGMITSDEPGIYIEGEFGVRIENEVLCTESDGLYGFETLTLCPYERDAILPELLTAEERAWLNNYHQKVLATLAPLLASDVREWLAGVTEAI